MCGVVEAAAVVSILSTSYQITQARDQRKEAEEFRLRKEEQERRNALASQRIATAEIHEQQVLDHASASLEIQANDRAAQQAASRATVTAGEIGAFGRSFEGLLGEFARQEAEFSTAVKENLAIKNTFAALNLQSVKLGTDARLINAHTLPTPKVNYAGYAMRGLSDFFQLQRGFDRVSKAR